MDKKRTFIRLWISIIVLLLISSTLPSFVHSSEDTLTESSWPKFRRDLKNTGRYEDAESEPTGDINWIFETGDEIHSSPTIGPDGEIYIGSNDGNLYARESDGSKRWTYETSSGISSTPAIGEDGSIYFGTSDGRFFSLNSEGEKNWVINETIESEIFSSPVILDDGSILIGAEELYSFDQEGNLNWNYSYKPEDEKLPGRIVSTPAVDEEGNIYFGYWVEFYAFGAMIAVDSDGNELWDFRIPDAGGRVLSSPVLDEQNWLYFGSFNGRLYALDRQSGGERWNRTTGDEIYSSPAIGPDGTIYVGSGDNNLYAVSPRGWVEWTFETEGEIYSSPAVGPEGMIYFGSYDNHTYSIYPNGTERWSIETDDGIFSSPAISSDGMLYFGSYDSGLYSVGEERIKTSDVKTLTGNEVALHGELMTLPEDEVDVFFRYRKEGDRDWKTTEIQKMQETGEFQENLEDMSTNTTYEFMASMKYDGIEARGKSMIFSTPEHIRFLKAESPEGNQATLFGEVISLPDSEELEVLFRYREKGDEEWIESEKLSIEESGGFNKTVSGLRGNTTYEVIAVMEWNEVEERSEPADFTTDETEGAPFLSNLIIPLILAIIIQIVLFSRHWGKDEG